MVEVVVGGVAAVAVDPVLLLFSLISVAIVRPSTAKSTTAIAANAMRYLRKLFTDPPNRAPDDLSSVWSYTS